MPQGQGRFKIYDPETTHTVTVKVDQDLYEQIREEVVLDHTTIQRVATQILRDGIEQRQKARLDRLRAEKERRAQLREEEALVGVAT